MTANIIMIVKTNDVLMMCPLGPMQKWRSV